MANAERLEDRRQPEGRLCRRIAGQPPLPVFREQGRRRRPERRGGAVPLHRRRRDRPRARPPRVPRAGRRPGHRPADRPDARQPEGRGRRRDARVHRHVPGHGQDGARRRLRRDRRLVRDAGQGRALARQPLSRRRSTRSSTELRARPRARLDDGASAPGLDPRSRTLVPDAVPTTAHDRHAKATSRRPPAIRSTGSAPTFYDEASRSRSWSASSTSATAAGAASACATSFPTLFDLVDERHDGEVDGVDKEDYWKVVDQCYLCDLCYMTKCPYVPPHPWNVDFPHLMLRAKAIKFKQGRGRRRRDSCSRRTDAHRPARRHPDRRAGGQRGQPHEAGAQGCWTRRCGVDRDAWLPDLATQRFRSARAAQSRRRPVQRRRSARRARSRSSRPATSTTTSRASATTCSSCSSTTRSRTCSSRRKPAAACRSSSSAISTASTQLKDANIPVLAQLRARGLRDPDAGAVVHADVQAGAAADVSRRCRRAGRAGGDVRSVRVLRRARHGRPAEDRFQARRSARSATTSRATRACRTSAEDEEMLELDARTRTRQHRRALLGPRRHLRREDASSTTIAMKIGKPVFKAMAEDAARLHQLRLPARRPPHRAGHGGATACARRALRASAHAAAHGLRPRLTDSRR